MCNNNSLFPDQIWITDQREINKSLINYNLTHLCMLYLQVQQMYEVLWQPYDYPCLST